MLSYQSKVTVGRPPEVTFEYLVDPAKQALWSDVPMRQLTPGALNEGSQMELTFAMGPIKAHLLLEITAVQPGRRMAWKTISGPILWDGEYLVAPVDAGASVNHEGRLRFTGLWRLAEPILGPEMRREGERELERFKAVVEAA